MPGIAHNPFDSDSESAFSSPEFEAFAEAIMLGHLDELMQNLDQENLSPELMYGVESLKYFRTFYQNPARQLSDAERRQVRALDAEWSMELIARARREFADKLYTI